MDDLRFEVADAVKHAPPEVDEDLRFEVAIAHSVDRAVARYRAKVDGWREFTDYVAMAPADVRGACRAQSKGDEVAA